MKKQPLKILYDATYIPFPIPCGGTTHVLEVARNLKKLGHHIVVVTKKIDKDRVKKKYGIEFYPVSWRFYDVPGGKRSTIYSHASKLTKLCMKYKIDIIIERESSRGSGAIASKVLNIPLVEEVNDPNCNKFSLSVAKKIYCTSKKIIPEEFRDKIQVVSWAANTDIIKPEDGAKNKVELFDTDIPLVGYIGSYNPWHGLEDIMGAIPLVIKKCDVKFVLIGDVKFGSSSTYKQKIEKIVKSKRLEEHVIFKNRIPYEQISKYISTFDLCLAPYNMKDNNDLAKFGFFYSPLKLFEYLASGKPVISTEIGNIKKIITPDRGILIPPGKPQELATAIIELLNDPGKRIAMGKNSRKFALAHNWFKHCQQIEKILEAAVRRS